MSKQLALWEDKSPLHNVFFAVRPTAQAARCISDVASSLVRDHGLGAKQLPPERFHVSLVSVGGFHGACPTTIVDAAKAAAAAVSLPSFNVSFDRVASFGGGARTRAVVLTGEGGATRLAMLRASLSAAMAERGLGRRQRRNFTPHLTMMYADQTYAFDIKPITWAVDELVLIDSLYGQSRHVLLGRWPELGR